MNIKFLYFFSFLLFIFLCITSIYIKNKFKGKYSSDLKVSVLLYYDNKSNFLSSILSTLIKYNNINDIIVIYKDNIIPFKHHKVRFFQDSLSKEYSSFVRYLYVSKCRNENILFLDNKIIPSQRLILKILYRYKNDPLNYYGVMKRSCSSSGYHTISLYNNIIISPIIFSSKEVFEKTWEEMLQDKQKMSNDNLDDILFQYHFEKIFGKQPILVRGKFKNLTSPLKNLHHYKLKNEYCKRFYKKNKYKEEDFY